MAVGIRSRDPAVGTVAAASLAQKVVLTSAPVRCTSDMPRGLTSHCLEDIGIAESR
jgi:hypothetical protein